MKQFCHLHVHDQYSLLDGIGSCESYVARAKELGFDRLALSNHANVNGAIKFQNCCVANGIKPILGCELYIVKDLRDKSDKREKHGHVLVLAKDAVGWNNLTKMLTIANIDGFYRKPRIDHDTLFLYREGLVISTACASSFVYNDCGLDFFEKLANEHGDDLCLEIMPIGYGGQEKHNKRILSLKKRFPWVDLIATNDCHYPCEDDSAAQEMLLAMQTKAKWDDPGRWRFDAPDLFLKSREEMVLSFRSKHGYVDEGLVEEAIDNTIKVAEKCDFLIKKSEVFFPNIVADAREYLEATCLEGLQSKAVTGKAEYRKRLFYEIEMLDRLGFLQYFVVIQDIVKWCKGNNILVGPGRGSVGASLVAFLMGITNVDPVKHDLLLERFISPDRVDLPDIDLDFEDVKRKDVRKYLEDKYGEFNIAGVSTFLKMKSKMVFRDVCRVYDVPLELVNKVAKNIDDSKEPDISSDQKEDVFLEKGPDAKSAVSVGILLSGQDGKRLCDDYPSVELMCNKLYGQVRGIGKHAAAAIITREDLRDSDRCNLVDKDGAISVNWDKKDAEHVGMLKIDILGLSNLSMVHYAQDLVRERHGVDLNFDDVDLKDKRVLREFSLGNCVGIFQFGTYGLTRLLKDLRADSFELLTHATAIYRPASLRSGMVEKFKLRRAGMESSVHDNPLDEFLLGTCGIIIYQEQAMQITHNVAGLSFEDSDKIRKLLDKEDRDKLKEKYMRPFVRGCVLMGIEAAIAIEIWDLLLEHCGYGFNKSHAVGYTILSFINMFLKVYYPAEFMCASLSFSGEEVKWELMKEAERLGVSVMTPKVGVSLASKWAMLPQKRSSVVYMPFIDVFGVGKVTAQKLGSVRIGAASPRKNGGFFSEDIVALKDDIGVSVKIKAILDDIAAYDNKIVHEPLLRRFYEKSAGFNKKKSSYRPK